VAGAIPGVINLVQLVQPLWELL